MALTKLDPNVIGQDSTGTGKITSAGGSVSIDSSGNVRIANSSANSVLFAADGTVGVGVSSVLSTYKMEVDHGTSTNFLALTTRNSSAQVKRLYIQSSGLDSTPVYTFATGAAGTDPALAFAPAGTERVRIDISGRVIIGNTAVTQSSSERFEVYGGMSLLDYNDDSVATVYIRNRSTTAGTIQPYIYFNDNGGNRGGYGVKYSDSSTHTFAQGGFNWYTGSAGFSGLALTLASNGNFIIGSNTSANASYNIIIPGTANNTGYRSNIWGNGGTGQPSFEQYVYDKQAGTGNQEVVYMTGRLNGSGKGIWNFQTKSSTTWYNTMTMLDGNVGIGNTTPGSLLTISTNTTAANAVTLHYISNANNQNASILFNGSGYPYIKLQGWTYNYGPDQGAFSVYTNYNSGGAASSSGAYLNERFRIQPDGSTYNSTGTWGTLSDARLKENITPCETYLDKLMQLEVVLFSMIEEQKDSPDRIGLIAQQVEPILPELVEEVKSFKEGEDDDHKAIRYSRLIPMLLKAMQEQQEQINELKAKA
jgi:Chaperone of endosialidase